MHFIISNLPLFLAAVGSGIMLLWPLLRRSMTKFPEVDAQEAVRLINQQDAVVLDVREHHEYASGHLLQAKHIPSGKVNARIGEIEAWKDKPLLVYCRSGARSFSVCMLLSKQGFSQVYNLKGGIMAWESAKLPVEK